MRYLLVAVLVAMSCFAQAQTFMRNYGGAGSDYSRFIALTPDSGFAILGVSNSYTVGSNDLYLVRTDKWGDTLWTRNYGGTGNEIAASVALCSDSGFVVAGTTSSFGTGTPTYTNWYVVRTNKFGDTLWTKTYGTYSNDLMFHARENQDGSFIFLGYQDIGGWAKGTVIKTNSSGYPLWTTYVGSSGGSHSYESMELPTGEYITCNSALSGTYNVIVQKLSAGGALLLSNNIHSSGQFADAAFSLVPAHHGGYMALGIYGNYGSYNIWLLRLNDNLDTLWTRRFPGEYSVAQLWNKDVSLSRVNDGYVICGTYFNATSSDIKLLKVDTLGIPVWTRYHGGAGEQYGFKAIVTPDFGLAACGYNYLNATNIEFFLIKTDSSGNIAVSTPPLASAGLNLSKCAGDSVLISSSNASNYNSLRWTSSGSGYFNDTTVLHPKYYPSAADITAGSVILTLRAIALGHPQSISSCTLSIHPLPQVHLLGLDTAYCAGSPAVQASGLPAGGTFNGNGIGSNGLFSITMAGLGSHMLRYSYTNPTTSCIGYDSVVVNIRPKPDINLLSMPVQGFCPGDSVLITVSSGGGAAISWLYNGNLLAGLTDTGFFIGQTGNYQAIAMNGWGCSDSSGISSLFHHPMPQVSLGADTILCAGDLLILDGGASHTAYAWSTGSSTQSIQVDSTGHGLQPFDIWLSVRNGFNCEASDSIRIQFLDCSSIAESMNEGELRIYPNPCRDIVSIEVGGVCRFDHWIEVYNTQGKLLERHRVEGDLLKINLEHLSSGLYFLRMSGSVTNRPSCLIKE